MRELEVRRGAELVRLETRIWEDIAGAVRVVLGVKVNKARQNVTDGTVQWRKFSGAWSHGVLV